MGSELGEAEIAASESVLEMATQRLSPRQREVFHLYCHLTANQIAFRLSISPSTVKNHLTEVFRVFEEIGMGFASDGCKGRYYCLLYGLSIRDQVLLTGDQRRVVRVNPKARHE